MMLGARTAAWAKTGGGGWTNPYCTGGLVAMWDGEWNAGAGIHDDMQRVVNLASTDDTLANVNVFDDYFSAGTKLQTISTRIDAGCTVECVISFGNEKGWIFNFGSIANAQINIGCVVGAGDAYQINYYRPNGLVPNQIYSLSFTGGVILKNGNILNLGSLFYTATNVQSWRFGNKIETGSKIYTVRLYNKDLLQSEIEHNYAIDKARFNLP